MRHILRCVMKWGQTAPENVIRVKPESMHVHSNGTTAPSRTSLPAQLLPCRPLWRTNFLSGSLCNNFALGLFQGHSRECGKHLQCVGHYSSRLQPSLIHRFLILSSLHIFQAAHTSCVPPSSLRSPVAYNPAGFDLSETEKLLPTNLE